ncbi:MAG: rRNA maturation RNase YbeY [Actinomycetota bacterium]|jgi:probable rRNA maturation factor|nr:rRNA maturation RNase YbeY [Actinomycetota bacterium]
MKVNLINRQDEIKLNLGLIKKVASFVSCHFDKDKKYEVNLILVSKEEIRQINNQYRQKDAATDVISFSYLFEKDREDIKQEIEQEKEMHGFYTMGEIIICPLVAQDNASSQRGNWNLNLEICLLIVHGFLHIYGYDHENQKDKTVMFDLQEAILQDTAKALNL